MDRIRAQTDVDEADIKLLMAQTQTTRNKAIKALKNHPNDLLGAILEVVEDDKSHQEVEMKEVKPDDKESEEEGSDDRASEEDGSDDEESEENGSDEESEEDDSDVDEADIRLVMAQTQTTRNNAISSLKKHKGDLLGAILEVTHH
jgi:NACalpha-BTF3-like transcription factor